MIVMMEMVFDIIVVVFSLSLQEIGFYFVITAITAAVGRTDFVYFYYYWFNQEL